MESPAPELSAPENAPLAAWEKNAASWDEGMGDNGNDYFQFLELPALERMIQREKGQRALDLATGNGLVARWLAQAGISVTATDGSKAMLDRAYQRSSVEQGIEFRVLDVTDDRAWDKFISDTLGAISRFDIVTMNMAIMDIQNLEPLATSLGRILKPDGCFVATILHPLLFTSGADRQLIIHENPETGLRETKHSIVLSKYMNVPPARQLLFAKDGQPQSPFCFHRPLHELFAPFFRAGLVLDALEEPNFDESFRDHAREYSSKNFTQFPKILAFRMRRMFSN